MVKSIIYKILDDIALPTLLFSMCLIKIDKYLIFLI